MAIYHYAVQVLSRSKGQSSVAAAAYRAGESLHDRRLGLTHNYTRKTQVAHTEILAPAHAPSWVFCREELWNQIEAVEKRKDSQVAREVVVALPKELALEQSLDLLRGFCQEQFINLGMVADIAIHWLDRNPHAHILLTTRSLDLEAGQFGQKNRNWNSKDLLNAQRQAWAVHVNAALVKVEAAGRVDHRSLAARGIARQPQIHLGRRVMGLLKRNRQADFLSHPRLLRYQAITQRNAELSRLEEEIAVEKQRIDMANELLTAAHLVLKLAKRKTVKGKRYEFDQNSITAKDGRGILVSRQGDLLVLSEQLTEADRDYFKQQQEHLQNLMQQSQQKQKQPQGQPGQESDPHKRQSSR